MRQFNPKTAPEKPEKPNPLFPLATGRWAKKIQGRMEYSGSWADGWQKALENYLDWKDDPYAGRRPRRKKGEADTINKHCLPHAVSYTYEKRKLPGYGQDINTQFAKNGFDATVVLVREDGAGCYLVRTNTTALWFVETKSMGWKLYGYLDKPIK